MIFRQVYLVHVHVCCEIYRVHFIIRERKRNRYDANRRSEERKRTYRHNGVRQLTATV